MMEGRDEWKIRAQVTLKLGGNGG